MSAERLRDLADRIASAGPDSEAILFEEALALFGDDASDEEIARWQRYVGLGAFNELAVTIWRIRFAGTGFQLGALAGAASNGIANTWRNGDAQATVHQAATPALALLRAAATEAANTLDAQSAAQCPTCSGRGWFVTADARKQVCRHERAAA
jgi:hypothetical protein